MSGRWEPEGSKASSIGHKTGTNYSPPMFMPSCARDCHPLIGKLVRLSPFNLKFASTSNPATRNQSRLRRVPCETNIARCIDRRVLDCLRALWGVGEHVVCQYNDFKS